VDNLNVVDAKSDPFWTALDEKEARELRNVSIVVVCDGFSLSFAPWALKHLQKDE
jgi:hypothetical protein